jgi:hypothetical protein
MPYDVRIRMPDGNVAWLRMAGKRPAPCAQCGAPSAKLCDWILKSSDTQPPPIVGRAKSRRVRTCSTPICDACTSSPAPGKDLCPTHAAEWEIRLQKRSEVMNPPASAAKGAEAGNLNTEPRHRDFGLSLEGAQRPGQPMRRRSP